MAGIVLEDNCHLDADPMTEFLTYRSHVRAGVKKWLFDVLCG